MSWRKAGSCARLLVVAVGMTGWLMAATAGALEIKMVPPTGGATTSAASGVTPDGTIVVGDGNSELLKFDVATGCTSMNIVRWSAVTASC
ncbi:MAG: hypothetical protein ACPMAQ_01055 [Phycisphaerae bacterium]